MTDSWCDLIDGETLNALEALARRLKRSSADIAREAIREYVLDTSEMMASVEVAKDQAESGQVMTLEAWRRSRGR